VISAIFELILVLLRLYTWAIIAAAVVSTLTAFGVLDSRNRLVWTIADFLYRITEPALRPIRNLLPDLGSIDISPIILILLVQFVAVPLVITVRNGLLFGQWQFL
jgi:YggT family protein